MNSVPNSDSEQYTESKLSRVYSAHTLTQPMHMPRAPCRGTRWAVLWPHPRPCHACAQTCGGRALLCRYAHACAGAPCGSPPLSRYKSVLRDISHAACYVVRAATRIAAPLHRVVGRWASYCSRVARCVATQGRPLSHYTKFCIATLR